MATRTSAILKRQLVSVGFVVATVAVAAACGRPQRPAPAAEEAASAPALPRAAASTESAAEVAPPDARLRDHDMLVGPGRSARPTSSFAFDLTPPIDTKDHFVNWMAANRGEDPAFLAERWDRYQAMLEKDDLPDERTRVAFLLTPREEFVRRIQLAHAYEHNFLDIGFGVTISGPHAVGHMTSVLEIKRGDKVLEIGTGSGYQAAVLSHLTDRVWSIEIVPPLADRTRGVYDALIARGYGEYTAIHTRQADGYYGWEDAAPFDKIIVTCGIDHVPPPLLQQLKAGGVMVIPVGPPGAQHVLRVIKEASADGAITIARSDIYNGRVVPFVPLRGLEGNVVGGPHHK